MLISIQYYIFHLAPWGSSADTSNRNVPLLPLSEFQLSELERSFQENPNPSPTAVVNLASVVQLSERGVSKWFESRRQQIVHQIEE